MRSAFAATATGWALACAAAGPPAAPVSDGRLAMGTVLELTLHGLGEGAGRAALEELFDTAERLEALASRYRPESELSRLNRSAGRGPRRVDGELEVLLRLALAHARSTGGRFDVTVGPLVTLWKAAAERGEPPTAAALETALRSVGPDGVRLEGGGRVELREGVSIDLGGIAKGYALDRMLPVLRARGATAALLEFGQSSVWAIGAPPGHRAWRLLVRGPAGAPIGVIALRDRALSVSGSLGQWVEIGGRRYGHVLDPRSGRPLARHRQALVAAPSATLAEALSVALLVGGETEGLALVAAEPDCHGLLADADGRRWWTPGFVEALAFEPADAANASS